MYVSQPPSSCTWLTGMLKLTPWILVSSAITQPSIPSSQFFKFQRPSSLRRSSSDQGPMGQMKRFVMTSTKPAGG